MNEEELRRPLEEMSTFEIEKEIEHLSRSFRTTVDIPTGRTLAIAYPIDRKYRPISKTGRSTDEALRLVLGELRQVPLPPGLQRR